MSKEMVKKLAAMDPFILEKYTEETGVVSCFFCKTPRGYGHRPDCIWERSTIITREQRWFKNKEKRTCEKLGNAIDIIRTVALAYGDIPGLKVLLTWEDNLWVVKWQFGDEAQ